MATWGFTSLYLVKKFTNAEVASSILVAGVLLIEVFMRINTNMLVLFLEEIWSRNLGHLFGSPVRLREYLCGLIITCIIRTFVALIPALWLAKVLFGFSVFSLGWPLILFVGLLIMNGIWYAFLVLSLLLRYGLAAEWLAWMTTMLLTPLIAPYYPVSVLPDALQLISWSIPATYVFETVKTLMTTHELRTDYLWKALALNLFYFVVSSFIFWRAYQGARKRGGLLQVGE
jgi:ABC-2 type transport system permease protein